MMSLNKDMVLNSVLGSTGGKVIVKYNKNGDPLYMVRIPKFNLEDIDPSLGTGPHPAFIVNGVVKSEILIGAYQAIFEKGCAISMPGQSPKVSITFDQARAACVANGPGFHLMTNWEWAAVALWCLKNGFQPRGNTASGKSHESPYETGTGAPDNTAKTLAGTGPASWRHDNTIGGIADLTGNIWEWQEGFKIVDSKVYMPPDNDFTLAEASWPNPTGAQVIFPAASIATEAGFRTMTTTLGSLSDAVKKQLAAAMIIPNIASGNTPLAIFNQGGNQAHGGFWITPAGEMMPLRGGNGGSGAVAGLAALLVNTVRSLVNGSLGCRPAFIL
jgi:hypothetical protein